MTGFWRCREGRVRPAFDVITYKISLYTRVPGIPSGPVTNLLSRRDRMHSSWGYVRVREKYRGSTKAIHLRHHLRTRSAVSCRLRSILKPVAPQADITDQLKENIYGFVSTIDVVRETAMLCQDRHR